MRQLNQKLQKYYDNGDRLNNNIKFLRYNYTSGEIDIAINHIIRKGMYTYKETTGVDSSGTDFTVDDKTYSIKRITNKLIKDKEEYINGDGDALSFDNKIEYRKMPDYSKILIKIYKDGGESTALNNELSAKLNEWKSILDNDNNSCIFSSSILNTNHSSLFKGEFIEKVRSKIGIINLPINKQSFRFDIDTIKPDSTDLPESFLFLKDNSSDFDGSTFNTDLLSPHALCIIGYYQEDPADIETLYWLAWDSDQGVLRIIKYNCLAISSESYYIPEKEKNGIKKNVLKHKVLSHNIDKVGTYNKIGFNTVRSLPVILRDSNTGFKSILLRWFKHDFVPPITGDIDLSGADQLYTITGTQISGRTSLSKLNDLENKCIEKVYNHTSVNNPTSTSSFIANLELEKVGNPTSTSSYRPSNRVLVKIDVNNMPCGGYELDEQNNINTLTSLGVHIPYKNGEVDISIYSQLSTIDKTITLPQYSRRRRAKSSNVSFATVNDAYRIGGTNETFENTDAGLYQIPVTTVDGHIINLTTTNVYIMVTYTAPDYSQNHFSSDYDNEAVQKAYNYSTTKMLNNYKTYNYGKNNNCDMFGMPFERDIPARSISTNQIYANNREAFDYPIGKYGGWDDTVKEWYSVSYLENNIKRYAKLMNDSNFNKDMNFVLYVYGKDNKSTGISQSLKKIREDETIKEVNTPIQIETSGIITIPENDVTSIQLTSNKTKGTIEWTIVGGADQNIFKINKKTGLMTFSAFDYESLLDSGENNSYEVLVQASHSSGTTTKTFTIKVSDQPEINTINDGFIPSNITVNVGDRFICELKTDSIRQASTLYNVVWSVNETNTYEIIDNRYLLLKDGQTLTTTVTINATTGNITQTKIINLTRGANTIQISTDNVLNIAENTRDIGTIAASINSTLSIPTQSNDGLLFQLKHTGVSGISTNVLQWKNDTGADYENPSSSPLKTNIYKVTLKAIGINSADEIEKIFLIKVVDVDDDKPLINTNERLNINENLTNVVTLISDKDVSWSITGGDDGALFKIVSSNNLVFKNAPDFEFLKDNDRNNEYIVKVRATRTNNVDNNIFNEKTLYVTINNVVEQFEFETSFGQLFQQFPYHDSQSSSSNNGDTGKNIPKIITIKNITGVPNGARIEVRFKDKDNKKTNTCTIHRYNGETEVVIDLQASYKSSFAKTTNSIDDDNDLLRFFIEVTIKNDDGTVYSKQVKTYFNFLDQYEPFKLNNNSNSPIEIPSGRAKKVKISKKILSKKASSEIIDKEPKQFVIEKKYWIKGDILQVVSPDLELDDYTRSYQWYRIVNDDGSREAINDATTDTYTVTEKDVQKSSKCVGKLDVNVVYSKGRDKFGFTLSNYIDPLKNYVLKDSYGWRNSNVKFETENSLELMDKNGSSYTVSENQYIYNIGTPSQTTVDNQQLNWCNNYITSLSIKVNFLENLSQNTGLRLNIFTDNSSTSVFETEQTADKDAGSYIFGEIQNTDRKSFADVLKQLSDDPTGKFYDIRVSTIDEPRNFVEKRIAVPKLVVIGEKIVGKTLNFEILPTKSQLEKNLSDIITLGNSSSITFDYVLKKYTYDSTWGWVSNKINNKLANSYTLTDSENDTYFDITGTITINGAKNTGRKISIGDINASCFDTNLHNITVQPASAPKSTTLKRQYYSQNASSTLSTTTSNDKDPVLDIKYTQSDNVSSNKSIIDNQIDYGKDINLTFSNLQNYIFYFDIEPKAQTGIIKSNQYQKELPNLTSDYLNNITITVPLNGGSELKFEHPKPLIINSLSTYDSNSVLFKNTMPIFEFEIQELSTTISGIPKINFDFSSSNILNDKDIKIGIYNGDISIPNLISTFTISQPDTIKVTVASGGDSNKYVLDDVSQKEISLFKGFTYEFDTSDTTVSNHPFRLITYIGNTEEYTTGVTHVGNLGKTGSKTIFVVPTDNSVPDTLYYYCSNHSGMGGEIKIKEYTGEEITQSVTIKNVKVGAWLVEKSNGEEEDEEGGEEDEKGDYGIIPKLEDVKLKNIDIGTWYRTDSDTINIKNFDTNNFRTHINQYFMNDDPNIKIKRNVYSFSTLPSENLILKFTAVHKDNLDDNVSNKSNPYTREFTLKSNAENYHIQLISIRPLIDSRFDEFVVSQMNTKQD